jgi:hypothetical protein
VARIARLHAIVGEVAGDEAGEVDVLAGIETDRGP